MHDPQIILGLFDPDPMLLGMQGGGAKDQKVPEWFKDQALKLRFL